MSIKNIAIGIFLGLVGGALGFYAEHRAAAVRAEALVERLTQQLALDANLDLAAIITVDCDTATQVIFIKRSGERDVIAMPTIEHQGGIRRRLSIIGVRHTLVLWNKRACGDSI